MDTLDIKDDEYWMRRAFALADKAKMQNEIPVGAVLVQDNQLIAEGWNQMIGQHDPTAHAEIVALRKAGLSIENYRLLDMTLYVTLEPCIMCAGALIHARIKRIVYGAKDFKTGAAGSFIDIFSQQHLNHYIEVQGGILEQACSEQLSLFFKERRAQKKRQKQTFGQTSAFNESAS
nr:tRNA adenosine(34) deaminase TadA [Thorsellia anophelis]